MILSGLAIHEALKSKQIVIDPFEVSQLGPNSYDFRLGSKYKLCENYELDSAKANPTLEFTLDRSGLLLQSDRVYLFNTYEKMGSTHYVPIIRGRSSVGRLGLFIDITADLIDIGSINQWTLQLHAVTPVKVYPGMLIGQVTFWCVEGKITLYSGKYSQLESPCCFTFLHG